MTPQATPGDAAESDPAARRPGNGRHGTTCAFVAASLAAFALGALDPAEGAAISAHLAVCPPCAALAVRYDGLVAWLARAVPPVDPPPRLRARLLAAAAADGSEQRATRRNILRFRPGAIARLVAVAAVLLLVASNVVLWERSRDQGAQIAAVSQGHMEQYDLTGTTSAPRALGMVYVAEGSGRGWLLANDLPPLPAGRVYQFWLLDAAGANPGRVSGGLFTTDAEGRGYLLISAPDPVTHYSSMGITVEPPGGSPAPTSPPVLLGTLT